MNKVRVLHLVSTAVFSGAENVACQIINGFANDKNYEMIYCSPLGSNEVPLKNRNINHLILKKFSYFYIRKAIKYFKPDIIHAHDIKASVIAALFTPKIKVVSHIHGNHENMRKLDLKTIMFNTFSKKIDKIIWVSDSALENYYFNKKDYLIAKSVVIYNVINPEEILKKSNEESIKKSYDIIYVGRLTYPKNPIRLIELLGLVKSKYHNLSAAIVGNGEYKEAMLDKISELKLDENVDMLGFQNNPAAYMKKSKIMVMTSIYEGTPMCILESIAMGVPIVSTPTDGISKIVENGVNGFLSDSNEELANYIVELLSDEKKYNLIKKSTIELNKKINDFYGYIKKIDKIYKEI